MSSQIRRIIPPNKKPKKEELKNYLQFLKETSNQNKEKENKDEKLHTVHND